jgi:glucosamine 6-phosphate synthetase-like amidotransferase/phosphosugar isomerase protein
MKINEVPQDNEAFKGKSDVHKLIYATKEDGSYTSVTSEGWEVENLATTQAWEAVLEDLKATEEKVKKGELSPIPYFMQKSLMELPVLAKYMGKWRWQVKRHFKPEVFRKLDDKTLEQYCSVFGISLDTLKNFDRL